jgi:hypothetical protein
MSYTDSFFRDLRLAILRCLLDLPAEPVNDSLLYKRLKAVRHPADRDQFDAQLAWLSSQGLIRLERIHDAGHLMEAELLFDGEQVARGTRQHPHIDAPSRPRARPRS